MYDIEREDKILEILKEKRTISVNALADMVYCSGATVRRDLNRMEKKGLVWRTFGAVTLASTNPRMQSSFELRENVSINEKKALCQKISTFIKDNQTIFIDSSSTLIHIVPILSNFKNLLIITNGLRIAEEIAMYTEHEVIVVGGKLHPHTNSILGASAVKQISQYHADLFLFSCAGFDEKNGFSDSSLESVEVKTEMIENSDLKICAFDNHKVGFHTTFKICEPSDIDHVITDAHLSKDSEKLLEGTNIHYCH